MSMKALPEKRPENLYIRTRKTGRLGDSQEEMAEQLLKVSTERLGVYRVPRKRLDAFVEPYLTRCKKLDQATTVDDKRRTLNAFEREGR